MTTNFLGRSPQSAAASTLHHRSLAKPKIVTAVMEAMIVVMSTEWPENACANKSLPQSHLLYLQILTNTSRKRCAFVHKTKI